MSCLLCYISGLKYVKLWLYFQQIFPCKSLYGACAYTVCCFYCVICWLKLFFLLFENKLFSVVHRKTRGQLCRFCNIIIWLIDICTFCCHQHHQYGGTGPSHSTNCKPALHSGWPKMPKISWSSEVIMVNFLSGFLV